MYWLRVTLICLAMAPGFASALGRPPDPLKGMQPATTPGLLNGRSPIVTNRKAAVQLGKALFWDANVGSDGMACGSCHFHAGADGRTRNQLNSGQTHTGATTAATFEMTASGAAGGPDYSLTASDFPLHRFANPADRDSAVLFTTDDVVGSSGTFLRNFEAVNASDDGNDQCVSAMDGIFRRGGVNTRRVTSRNAPSVINAAFNFRNFWDGRANNSFNGETAFGPRDPAAGVWIVRNGKTTKTRLLLQDASLASLAVAPPMNDVEMSCVHRNFHELGRKLLPRRPLAGQDVHPQDSVLGAMRDASGRGLSTTYDALIRQAFARRFWSGEGDFGSSSQGHVYTQMEANFAFFFGLAIQLYEQTLISDQAPFDSTRDAANIPTAFDDQQKRGLSVFLGASCANCHSGSLFSSAVTKVYRSKKLASSPLVNRTVMFEELDGFGVAQTLIDTGFHITSVAPPDSDIGLGGEDPNGNPFSFVEQYVNSLSKPEQSMVDPVKISACELGVPFTGNFLSFELRPDPNGKRYCRGSKFFAKVPSPEVVKYELDKPGQGRMMVSVKGAFKVPSLRNVELTGPYMHNGSMKSLEEVVEFYNRGGNNFHNPQHPETLVFPHFFSDRDKTDLVAFLKTLTDERVRWERAPFDHPELLIPEGHDERATSQLGTNYAADRLLHIPAVGRNGRAVAQGPLLPFEDHLER